MKIKFIGLLILVAFIACKQKVEEAPKEAKVLPEDFEVFYEKFANDSLFQINHIVFPLEGRRAMQSDSDTINLNVKWEKKDWLKHGPYDDMGGTYSRSYLNFSGIITEEISDNSGNFKMIRRFAKLGEEWNLIYYKEMGR